MTIYVDCRGFKGVLYILFFTCVYNNLGVKIMSFKSLFLFVLGLILLLFTVIIWLFFTVSKQKDLKWKKEAWIQYFISSDWQLIKHISLRGTQHVWAGLLQWGEEQPVLTSTCNTHIHEVESEHVALYIENKLLQFKVITLQRNP